MMTTVEVGGRGEAIAAAHLHAAGYAILERNFRVKRAEVDIVARDRDGTLCFVEVRSRGDDSYGNAAETIDRRKREQVTRGARAYLVLRKPAFTHARFDVVAITGDRIDLIQDAWRL